MYLIVLPPSPRYLLPLNPLPLVPSHRLQTFSVNLVPSKMDSFRKTWIVYRSDSAKYSQIAFAVYLSFPGPGSAFRVKVRFALSSDQHSALVLILPECIFSLPTMLQRLVGNSSVLIDLKLAVSFFSPKLYQFHCYHDFPLSPLLTF